MDYLEKLAQLLTRFMFRLRDWQNFMSYVHALMLGVEKDMLLLSRLLFFLFWLAYEKSDDFTVFTYQF